MDREERILILPLVGLMLPVTVGTVVAVLWPGTAVGMFITWAGFPGLVLGLLVAIWLKR